eukprot:Skav231395  [mRNA]  locus=scaffold1456:85629:91709:+ [translate_table: standard]
MITSKRAADLRRTSAPLGQENVSCFQAPPIFTPFSAFWASSIPCCMAPLVLSNALDASVLAEAAAAWPSAFALRRASSASSAGVGSCVPTTISVVSCTLDMHVPKACWNRSVQEGSTEEPVKTALASVTVSVTLSVTGASEDAPNVAFS